MNCCFVNISIIVRSIIGKHLTQRGINIEIRCDTKCSVTFNKIQAEELEIVNNDGILQRAKPALPDAVKVSVGEFKTMAAVNAAAKLPPTRPGVDPEPAYPARV